MIKNIISVLLAVGFILSSIGWVNANNEIEATEKIVSERDREIEEQLTEIAKLEDIIAIKEEELKAEKEITSSQSEEIANKESEIQRLKEELKKKTENNLGTFEMSSYVAFCREGCGGTTKVGYDVSNTITYDGYRIIAVDPNVIPLWSIVRIHTKNGSFEAIALDTGGAIKGKKIDFLVASESEAYQNGRQAVSIEMIRRGK